MKITSSVKTRLMEDLAKRFKEDTNRNINYQRDADLEELGQLVLKHSWEWARGSEQYGVAPSVSTLKRFFRKNNGMSPKFFYAFLKYIGVPVDWIRYVETSNAASGSQIITDRSNAADILLADDLCPGDIVEVKYGECSSIKFKLKDANGDNTQYFQVIESTSGNIIPGDYIQIPYFVVGAPVVGIDVISESRNKKNMTYISGGRITSFEISEN